MEFKSVLNPETIITHLDVNDKAQTLDAMADLFMKAGVINDKEQFIKDVYVREAEGETGIGDYIAIPHGRSEAVVTPGAAIAVLDHEIEWETLDGEGVRVVILFAVGTDNEAALNHLRLLAMFSKRLGDDRVHDRLLEADTVADVIAAFDETDIEDDDEAAEEDDLDLGDLTIL